VVLYVGVVYGLTFSGDLIIISNIGFRFTFQAMCTM